MNTCYPARKQNGENYATLDEMMRLISREPHGSWLAGTNKMWHGGIHISEVSAPGSLLTPETTATAVPLPCMADGELVAWRLGRDYQKGRYLSHAVQYSTTFVLVKSVCKPDPDNAQTWLEFYSLYMSLAPLSAFEKCRCMRVIADGGVRKHPQGQYESSQPDVIPDASEGTLAKDARVIILKEGLFTYRGQSGQPFGLAQELDNEGRECGKPFRVTTSPAYMAPDGEEYARLPVWMQQAVAKGVFDAVVKPDTPLAVSAGDAIGFLGEDIAPAGMAKIRPSAYVHLEVLSTDSRMPGFLTNPGGVRTGRKYIRIHPDAVLYIDSGETFIRTTATVNKDKHLILPVDKCNPREWEGRTYYQAGKNYWLRQDGVDLLNQFDLEKRGFTALEEESTPDMSASIKEGWVTSTCRWLAEQVMPERGVRETLTSRFYQSVAEKLDSDRSGDLSGRELYAALHHPDMGVRDIVSRMVVKHESEWFGGSGHQKWTAFFQDYDTLRIDFAKKWLDDMEWMSQVEPFTSGQAVWHMHPVVFLRQLVFCDYDFTTRSGVIHAIISECKKQDIGLNSQIAYVLATVKRETGNLFQPVREGDWPGHIVSDEYRRRHFRYYPYYGRGYVQITWDYNYGEYSNKLGIDMVASPDLALAPQNALFILVDGFKNGVFAGHPISEYINEEKTDFINARRCINGLDHAQEIKEFADDFLIKLNNGELQ